MAVMPGALWRPIGANFRSGAMRRPVMGQVEHHIVGSGEDAWALFNNPAVGKSAHFIVYFDGSITQCVDTNDVAYATCNGNWTGWVSIENESPSVDDPNTVQDDVWAPLTDAQVSANGRILKWLNDTEGVAIQVTDDINVSGVAYHSMNPGPCNTNWGITGCPGDAIIAQRQAIVDAANGSAPIPPPSISREFSMIVRLTTDIPGIAPAGSLWGYTTSRWVALPSLSPGVSAQDIDPVAFLTIRAEQERFRVILYRKP